MVKYTDSNGSTAIIQVQVNRLLEMGAFDIRDRHFEGEHTEHCIIDPKSGEPITPNSAKHLVMSLSTELTILRRNHESDDEMAPSPASVISAEDLLKIAAIFKRDSRFFRNPFLFSPLKKCATSCGYDALVSVIRLDEITAHVTRFEYRAEHPNHEDLRVSTANRDEARLKKEEALRELNSEIDMLELDPTDLDLLDVRDIARSRIEAMLENLTPGLPLST